MSIEKPKSKGKLKNKGEIKEKSRKGEVILITGGEAVEFARGGDDKESYGGIT
ncbi:hypothetical protein AALP_AAs43269U000100 [Arabis alpina]|uniref:Uncharacterized protein n=1 Tax=Arabis alpina TaxID=50452 RepID=A0A087G0I8_ARAAL|nr:hypothetical protein AALP_AAs43269U000100 [Arabis alpina]